MQDAATVALFGLGLVDTAVSRRKLVVRDHDFVITEGSLRRLAREQAAPFCLLSLVFRLDAQTCARPLGGKVADSRMPW